MPSKMCPFRQLPDTMLPTFRKPVLATAIASALVGGSYVLLFGYDLPAIAVHILMASLLVIACVAASNACNALLPRRLAQILVLCICFLFLFVLAATYISNFLSSYFWSEPMYDSLLINSFKLLAEYYAAYFAHLPDILQHFNSLLHSDYSLLLASLSVGLVTIPLVLALLGFLSYRMSIHLRTSMQMPANRPRTAFITLALFAATALAGHLVTMLYAEKNWRGEILSDTFFSRSHIIFSGAWRDHIAETDRDNFRRYTPATGNKQNLVLIILDAMREDFVIDPDHPPPFISSMIAQGKFQWQKQAYSICSYSTCGIMGILSSKDVRDLHPDNVKLQEVLKQDGYHTFSILCGYPDWYGMKSIYQKTYDHYIDSDVSGHPVMLDDIITDTIPTFDLNGEQPFFLYLRLMSTHEYGRLKPEFSSISRYEYANRVLQADDYLKKIFAELEAKGVLHNTTIMITGDHGDSRGEKHEYGHNISLYTHQIHVPIFIYDEHMAYRSLPLTSTLDIAPTLVSRAGLPVPAFWSGISMLENTGGDRVLFHSKAGARYQTDRMRAVTWYHAGKIYKYIFTGAKRFSASPHKEELFELVSDPEEENNLMATVDPAVLTTIRQYYRDHFRD